MGLSTLSYRGYIHRPRCPQGYSLSDTLAGIAAHTGFGLGRLCRRFVAELRLLHLGLRFDTDNNDTEPPRRWRSPTNRHVPLVRFMKLRVPLTLQTNA